MRFPFPRRFGGFTLIELMVAIAIVGIIAAFAYPNFTSMIQRSRRADAIAALTAAVQAQERYRSNRRSYAPDLGTLNIDASKVADYYDLGMSDVGPSGYQVTATVKESGAQRKDTTCWTLSVLFQNSNLTYLATDKSNQDQKAKCWPR